MGKVDSVGTFSYKRDGADVTDPVLSNGSTAYTPGVSERNASASRFYHSDRLGTNALESDTSQSLTATRTYDASGLLTSSAGTSASPFGFSGMDGYEEDCDSALKLLGHRYYDASTGRFLTRDPSYDGRNWYDYCDNNPLRSTDPSGLDSVIKKTVDEIATYATNRYEADSQLHRVEYGGWIYAVDGGYTFTVEVGDSGTGTLRKKLKHKNTVAGWHTHPFEKGESGFGDPNIDARFDRINVYVNGVPEYYSSPTDLWVIPSNGIDHAAGKRRHFGKVHKYQGKDQHI